MEVTEATMRTTKRRKRRQSANARRRSVRPRSDARRSTARWRRSGRRCDRKSETK